MLQLSFYLNWKVRNMIFQEVKMYMRRLKADRQSTDCQVEYYSLMGDCKGRLILYWASISTY